MFVFVLVGVVLGAPVVSKLTTGAQDFQDPASENVAARNQLEKATGVDPTVAVIALIHTDGPVASAAGRAKVVSVARELRKDPAVGSVVTFFNTGRNPSFLSRDGKSTYVGVSFKPLPDKVQADAAKRLEARFAGQSSVILGGPAVASEQINSRVTHDLAHAELLAAPLLLLLSLLFFRGLVAALLPIVCAVVSIMGSFLALRLLHEATPISIFATNLITGLGIGLGIDYSLFMVSRYREELVAVGPGVEALRRTLQTAGRTVAFSALTVAAGMSALLAFPQRFLYSMGAGGIFVALAAALSAVVFLPAILALLGTRVNALAPKRWQHAVERTARKEQTGPWYRLSRLVMRRAVPVAVLSAALMITIGIPFFHIKFTGVDATVLPRSASARQLQDELVTKFNTNRASLIFVAATAPKSAAPAVQSFENEVAGLPGLAAIGAPAYLGADTWRIDAISASADLAGASQDLVRSIRNASTAIPVRVGGETAAFIDQQSSVLGRLPIALGIASLTTLILLFLMTGSVVLPIKAVVMNILTIVATLGALVFVFQDGHLEGLLNYTSQGALDSTQPILIGAIAFALSTDYAVFLLTRIKEARAERGSDQEAVAVGMERTGRIVTAAALLLAIALGAFMTSQVVVIKELGFGVAFAVLIDAAVVRALLVPSLMRLLGRWNWWAPQPLRRLHERIGLHETQEPAARPAVGHE